jgi:hypothetical protein
MRKFEGKGIAAQVGNRVQREQQVMLNNAD